MPKVLFPHELGYIDLAEHQINTGEVLPGQQPLRRPPLTGREEEQRTAATDFVGAGYH